MSRSGREKGACRYTLWLLMPPKGEAAGPLTISESDNALFFPGDWFAGEGFPLKAFHADDLQEVLLMAQFRRGTVVLHLI